MNINHYRLSPYAAASLAKGTADNLYAAVNSFRIRKNEETKQRLVNQSIQIGGSLLAAASEQKTVPARTELTLNAANCFRLAQNLVQTAPVKTIKHQELMACLHCYQAKCSEILEQWPEVITHAEHSYNYFERRHDANNSFKSIASYLASSTSLLARAALHTGDIVSYVANKVEADEYNELALHLPFELPQFTLLDPPENDTQIQHRLSQAHAERMTQSDLNRTPLTGLTAPCFFKQKGCMARTRNTYQRNESTPTSTHAERYTSQEVELDLNESLTHCKLSR